MARVHKRDIERFENSVNRLSKIMDDIKAYLPNVQLVCFSTAPALAIVINDGEDDLYDCEEVVSIRVECEACS